ncbi:MAG: membrane protein insertase YidC [Candidatus Saccharibacteria bacterium]|nr:membrane protein insertase YidC [Candidatus Saccharibacteria bacterium]
MKDVNIKKIVIYSLIGVFLVGSMMTGSPFNFIDLIMVRPIVNILFVIFNLVHDFGFAIIIFTIIVKLVMLPLTIKQIRQNRLMRKLQPELTKIRKNCNGNKALESLQVTDLYKRYNFNPLISIVTLIIQLPVFIALFSAIKVIATPTVTDNLMNRAYDIVAYEGSEIRKLEISQEAYLADLGNGEISAEDKVEYDFHPKLFGVINLEAKASDVVSPNRFSLSAVFILMISIAASFSQYFVARQQMPSNKTMKSKKFRDLIKEAKSGKEVDENDISNLTTSQMGKMMPMMMFVIMINLHGALAFYYFLSNIITIIQQKVIYAKIRDDMDDATDRAMTRELKKIQEAEVVKNKKTGTKITRISAKDIKKKRR